MSEIEIKHFKREHKGAREKTMVTEKVEVDSETAQFLQKLEVRRLSRECHLTVDMRGKVPGECRGYLINNRVFYLDEISLGILNKGLKENNRQFTIATYEAIVNGAHTNRAMRIELERKEASAEQSLRRCGTVAEKLPEAEDADIAVPRSQGARYSPEPILSGYYRKRCEERVQYVTGVTLVIDGISYGAKTRDLSISGMQVYLKGAYDFLDGQPVQAGFTEIPDAFGIEGLVDIPYRIVNVAHKSQEVTLRLVRVTDDRHEEVNALMLRLIERLRQKYKRDVEDDLLTINASIHERLYTDNVTHVPLFYSKDAHGRPYLRCVAATGRNQPLLEFFGAGRGGFDFTPLALPQRLAHLCGEGAGRDMLLVMYKDDGDTDAPIHSSADYEVTDAEHLRAYIRHAMVHERYRMLRVSVVALRKTNESKLTLCAKRLHDRSQHDMALVREGVESLCAIGMVVDITKEISDGVRMLDQRAKSLEGLYDLSGLCGWSGLERKALDTNAVVERAELPVVESPDLIRFGYLERRREERYLLQTHIGITFKSHSASAVTLNVSVRGLKVSVASSGLNDMQTGQTVQVDFIGLQSKVGGNVNLKAIEYRVVDIEYGEKLQLMLERVINRDQESVNSFFIDLINRNRHKLPVDIEETLYAAKSRVHESILADNLINIPFFMARDDEGAITIQKVALNESPCRLADFFRQSDGSYDFGPLTEARRVYYVYDGVNLIARKESGDGNARDSIQIYLYMYREPAVPGRSPVMRSLADFEETDDDGRDQFLRKAVNSGDYRFVKIVATPISEMHNLEVDAAIDEIREHSRHRAFKLKEGFQRIVAQGEIIDVTEQILATLEIQ